MDIKTDDYPSTVRCTVCKTTHPTKLHKFKGNFSIVEALVVPTGWFFLPASGEFACSTSCLTKAAQWEPPGGKLGA